MGFMSDFSGHTYEECYDPLGKGDYSLSRAR